MAKFNDAFEQLNKDYSDVQKMKDNATYFRLNTTFLRFEATMREYLQDLSGDKINKIIAKLNQGANITPEDLNLIRLWVVGDADYFTKMENDFENWKKVLSRLVGEIQRYEGRELSLEDSLALRGILRDALSVMADILYFVEQKDRIEQFEESTKTLESDERLLLARILEQKLKDENF